MATKNPNARTHQKSYKLWWKMRTRCYNIKELNEKKCYKSVLICDEWQDYEKYKEWFDKYYIEGWEIDKDLLSVNDIKCYSPDTCCFLPHELNSFLSTCTHKPTTKSPHIGIAKTQNKYEARINTRKGMLYLGRFETLDEAINVYNKVKKQRFLEHIEKYKDQLEPRVLDALLKFSEKTFG